MENLPAMPAADRPLSRDSADGLVVAIGIVALAVAMGIGRFAFTPLLPLMLRDGSITPGAGAEWAAANYAGYLAGALTAARFSEQPRRGLLVALAGIVLTTLAVAAVGGWGGAALRFAAGVFSAWTLVCASAWCLGELARRSAAQRGAWIFTGVGLGITLAGLLTWWGGRQPAAALWLETGLLAALGTAAVAWALRAGSQAGSGAVGAARASPLVPQPVSPAMSPPMSSPMSPPMSSPMSPAMSSPPSRAHPAEASPAAATAAAPGPAALVLCYGAMGFGYIAPATFLPAMAREQVADPLVFGLTWPLFGLAAAASVAVAARWLSAWPRRRVWALAQATMALGTAVPLASQSLAALAASALFVGGTFMVATMAGLQMARERLPANPTPLLARMTAAFAAGQIAGPLLVRALVPAGLDPAAAVTCTLALATLALLASAAWLGRAAASSTDRRPIP